VIDEIFARLADRFQADLVQKRTVYYFSVDEQKWTVTVAPDGVLVEQGKTVDRADCVCKTDTALFRKIWQDGYRPGLSDFLSGAIKSNDPFALQEFLKIFGKGG
jgi:hypothetical protein